MKLASASLAESVKISHKAKFCNIIHIFIIKSNLLYFKTNFKLVIIEFGHFQ